MRKQNQLTDWLKNKPRPDSECNHEADMWCSNCLNFGKRVYQKLPDGTISKGFFISNKSLE